MGADINEGTPPYLQLPTQPMDIGWDPGTEAHVKTKSVTTKDAVGMYYRQKFVSLDYLEEKIATPLSKKLVT